MSYIATEAGTAAWSNNTVD